MTRPHEADEGMAVVALHDLEGCAGMPRLDHDVVPGLGAEFGNGVGKMIDRLHGAPWERTLSARGALPE